MGGLDTPLPRMLREMGWYLTTIPFHFHVNRPGRFLRNIAPLRTTRAARLGLDLSAASGLGWLGIRALQWRAAAPPAGPPAVVEPVASFDSWADELWLRSRQQHSLCAVRDAAVLKVLYPAGQARYHYLRLRSGQQTVAWMVILVSEMRDNQYFGNMRVGTILDCLALGPFIPSAVRGAAGALGDLGVDLSVTNQSSAAWLDAFRRAGFVRGPSNYGFSLSKAVIERLQPLPAREPGFHITRGDGDGRVNL